MKRVLLPACLLALFTTATYADTLSLTTLPLGGSISALPGGIAGWGFTLTDTTANYVILNDSFFTGSTTFGSYVDYLVLPGAPIYVAGPSPESSTVSQPWTPASTPPLGLGEFDINSTAPPGTVISGQIGVDYTLFSQDPNDPNFDPGSFVSAGQFFAPVTITVSTSTVPEPASGFLVGLGILVALTIARRRRWPAAESSRSADRSA